MTEFGTRSQIHLASKPTMSPLPLETLVSEVEELIQWGRKERSSRRTELSSGENIMDTDTETGTGLQGGVLFFRVKRVSSFSLLKLGKALGLKRDQDTALVPIKYHFTLALSSP